MAEKRRLRILAGRVATREILETIVKSERAQYKDFIGYASISSINLRLRELETCGLIEHHMAREEKREEWYTPTEAGIQFSKKLKEMDELDEQISKE